MKFKGLSDFDHQSAEKIAVIIINLGTPEAPTPKALRKYLKQFLSDHRVVEIPRLVWWFILNVIILNTRPKRSAKLYQSVWSERGSPLMMHTEDQAIALQKEFIKTPSTPAILVQFAMRYGSPSISQVIEKAQSEGAQKILFLPLYPQYSGATTGSTFDAIAEHFNQCRWVPNHRFVASYHDDDHYIQACADKISDYWQAKGKPEKLIFSYHGIPQHFFDAGDPYYCHCQKTTRLIAEKLSLPESFFQTTFQSRFGKAKWLEPYTDATLKSLPQQDITRVDVFCPGFSADCLETLEEIAVENQGYFIAAGGKEFRYISALNSDRGHIDALSNIVKKQLQGWLN